MPWTRWPSLPLALALTAGTAAADPTPTPREVRQALAGDTLVLPGVGGASEWVRLIGVGSPHSPDVGKPSAFQGRDDPPALAAWSVGKPVLLKEDPVVMTGVGERRRAYAHLAGSDYDLGWWLVRSGWAYVRRDYDFERKADYLAAEGRARSEGVGYWPKPSSVSSSTPPPARRPTASPRAPRPVVASGGAPASPGLVPRDTPVRRRPRNSSGGGAGLGIWEFGLSGVGTPLGPTSPQAGLMGSGGFGWSGGFDAGRTQSVSGYYRSDGTYVAPYYRRPPR